MDVIERHVRGLPPLDERWSPRAHDRGQLAAALRAGRVAGTATHPLDNVRANALMLIDGDPDKLFGLTGIAGALGLDEILDLVGEGAGVPIDLEARYGPVEIEPEPILDACEAAGDRLARAAADGERVVLATGHPIGLALLYHALDRMLDDGGAEVQRLANGERWRDPHLAHDWLVDHWGGVGVLTDGREPRHTHGPDAMQRMLDESRPDLVVADHGFAGAAIEAGVETLSIADVNDPALIVAKAMGRTDIVVVMDDHVRPDAYWPCFQAIASRF
ncbi:MAG: phosphatase [Actinomycetota bacterium]|nr:phosphatase [Actinomycetota bacterium]MDH5223306.1 phosphatase [Actinomycetota bacterium]